jgi:uncharacterized protein with HEPN domain
VTNLMGAVPICSQITQARRIIGFRNILVHGYDIVENTVVWDIVGKNLPVLHREIQLLLEGG